MRIQIGRAGALAVALCFSWAVQVGGQNRDDEAIIGSWEGTLTVTGGAQLTVVFNVERGADGGRASPSCPRFMTAFTVEVPYDR